MTYSDIAKRIHNLHERGYDGLAIAIGTDTAKRLRDILRANKIEFEAFKTKDFKHFKYCVFVKSEQLDHARELYESLHSFDTLRV